MSAFSRTPRSAESQTSPFAVETLEERRMMAASALTLGLNTNVVTSANYKSLVSLLRQSGTTTVRLWYGFGDYDARKAARVVTWAEKFKYDGFDVTLTVSPDGGTVGTAAQTTGLFQFLVSIPGLTDAVDRWEIGNEEDSSNYWDGSLKQYVGQFLAPASSVLHSVGEKVVSGGVSWNPEDVQKLVDQGMLRYVDYVGYHPYRSSYSDLVAKVAQVKAIAGDKPLVATEWNVRGHENDATPAAWAADVAKFWPIIRDNFYAAYYYAATVVNTPAGPAGVVNADGTPNEPFFSVYNSFQQTLDLTTPTDPSTTGGSTSGGSTSGGSTSGSGSSTGGSTGSNTGTGTSTGSTGSTGSTTGKGSTTTTTGHTGTGSTTKPASGGTTTGTSTGTTKPTTGRPSTGSTGTSGGTTTVLQHPKPVVKPKPKPVLPTITSLDLVNGDTDRLVKGQAGLDGTVTIDLSTLGTSNLTFLSETNSKVKSVVWTINGAVSTDSSGVFSLFGETRKRGMTGQAFKAGTYVITAQAFGGLNATGTAAKRQTYTINFVNSKGAVVNNAGAASKAAYLKRKAAAAAFTSSPTNSPASVLSGVNVVARKRHTA